MMMKPKHTAQEPEAALKEGEVKFIKILDQAGLDWLAMAFLPHQTYNAWSDLGHIDQKQRPIIKVGHRPEGDRYIQPHFIITCANLLLQKKAHELVVSRGASLEPKPAALEDRPQPAPMPTPSLPPLLHAIPSTPAARHPFHPCRGASLCAPAKHV